MMYQFAMLARGVVWKKEMLKDGALLALAKFPVYIAVLLLTASPLSIVMMPASTLISMLPIVLLFWISCPAMAGGWMMRRFLEKIYPELFRKKDSEGSDL